MREEKSLSASKKLAVTRYFVYILEASKGGSPNGHYYIGYTTNLKRRMGEHRSGKGSKFVRAFGFKKLLYSETHPTRSAAMKREAQLKTWTRAQKEALVKGKIKATLPNSRRESRHHAG